MLDKLTAKFFYAITKIYLINYFLKTIAHELCCSVIQQLVLESPVPASSKDEVFEALCSCVCEILEKHAILFGGMLRRFEVTDYRVFASIANELFEVKRDESLYRIVLMLITYVL